jgi:hypothetical protein
VFSRRDSAIEREFESGNDDVIGRIVVYAVFLVVVRILEVIQWGYRFAQKCSHKQIHTDSNLASLVLGILVLVAR